MRNEQGGGEKITCARLLIFLNGYDLLSVYSFTHVDVDTPTYHYSHEIILFMVILSFPPRCRDCLPEEWFCGDCDVLHHKKQPLHNRESVIDGFFKAIPPTTHIIIQEDGYCTHEQGLHHVLIYYYLLLFIPYVFLACYK